jgi:hypothetical protein
MIRDLRGDRLDEWADRVLADDLPPLHSFVNGLRSDQAAVSAGLTLPWSNGPTEAPSRASNQSYAPCSGARTRACSAVESSTARPKGDHSW